MIAVLKHAPNDGQAAEEGHDRAGGAITPSQTGNGCTATQAAEFFGRAILLPASPDRECFLRPPSGVAQRILWKGEVDAQSRIVVEQSKLHVVQRSDGSNKSHAKPGTGQVATAI